MQTTVVVDDAVSNGRLCKNTPKGVASDLIEVDTQVVETEVFERVCRHLRCVAISVVLARDVDVKS